MVYYDFRKLHMYVLVNPSPTLTKQSSNPYYPDDNFKRSINREPTFFADFKDQEPWETFNLGTIATACTQDVEDIYHNAYVPSTPDNISLFKEIKNRCTQFF